MLTSGRSSAQRGETLRCRGRSRGMSLTEVLVSMVIFAIGVLGLFSTHATAFNTYSDAKNRVDASLLADRLISEMWVDRANVADYAYAGHGNVTQARIAPWLAQVQQALPAADAIDPGQWQPGASDCLMAAARR